MSYRVGKLKQHMPAALDPLYVYFESDEQVRSFRIDYRINCSDLPDEVEGVLNVRILR